MRWLDKMTRSFFWRPTGCLPSLASLNISHGLTARWEMAPEAIGQGQSCHPLTVVELADGKVIGDLRLAATRQDLVVGGVQSVFGCDDLQNHFALRRRRFRLPHYCRGTALLLGTSNSDNYYHWLLDVLPRWKILQAATLSPYDFVLLPGRPSRFQDETLDVLGVPPAKRLRCSKNFVHQFERLVVPAMPFPVEKVAPWVCAWVRSLFPEKGSGPEKLYLSRRGACRRPLVDELALENALSSRGFAIVHTDQMSVLEQVQLFSSARFVVAPHGAALTNMIFAPAGAKMLELFHPQHKNRCYVNLARACGHWYAGLDGEATCAVKARLLGYEMNVSAVVEMIEEQHKFVL